MGSQRLEVSIAKAVLITGLLVSAPGEGRRGEVGGDAEGRR